ncbi:hypothetical protein V6N12_050433 [Hibiscus sabdariffa]|uniref:Uncharacterized protein n=1 Tax=Hibiscus sabdariffa TaxID=183260 RepID=A0ABR2GCP4_9ROSI
MKGQGRKDQDRKYKARITKSTDKSLDKSISKERGTKKEKRAPSTQANLTAMKQEKPQETRNGELKRGEKIHFYVR